MAEFADLLERIDRLSSHTVHPSQDATLLEEIEDLLAEGYMQALAGDARSRRMAARVERLVETLDEPGSVVEARRLALQRRTLDEGISELRAGLDLVREQFVRLDGGESTIS